MLLAGGGVRIGKNCDRGLEDAARGRRPRAAFSSPRSQFFPVRTDPEPDNNMYVFLLYTGFQVGLLTQLLQTIRKNEKTTSGRASIY